MDIKNRYQRNRPMLTDEEILILKQKKVGVIGCGGLGGYIIEMLARLGVGNIVAVDGDVFEPSNLNRQILSDEINLGKSKAIVAKERMAKVNSDIKVNSVFQRLSSENAYEILDGCDLVMDALDNIESRLILEKACESLDLEIVHGAISSWYGQVAVVKPKSKLLTKIYGSSSKEPNLMGNPSFTPATVASIQVSEATKILIGKGEILYNKLLLIDLQDMNIEIIRI